MTTINEFRLMQRGMRAPYRPTFHVRGARTVRGRAQRRVFIMHHYIFPGVMAIALGVILLKLAGVFP